MADLVQPCSSTRSWNECRPLVRMAMPNTPPDDMDLQTVAARLGKSSRWLQAQLAEDRQRLHPRLQYHHRIGRSPRWDERAYQMLRLALLVAAAPFDTLPASPSSSVAPIGISMAPSASKDAASAFARVLAFSRSQSTATPPRSSAGKRNKEIRDAILYGIRPSVPFAIAAEQYITRPRQRPLNAIDIARLQELTRQFGIRPLAAITESEWGGFIDKRMNGRAPATRERYIDLVMRFLTWCKARPRQWLGELPAFERDHQARDRRDRRARRVGELRPELIGLLIEHAAPHLKGQMAILWSTGARVSSVLHGCRLCDYLAAEGREQITFYNTKNGRPVTAAVHPWAAAVMRDYLAWRGRLIDREAALFLTDERCPYTDNGKAAGGQMKTAFRGMVKRAAGTWRARALRQTAALRRQGQGTAAREHWAAARSDLALLKQLTPHWFRHLLATTMLASGDLRSTMEQGGWLDPRSVLGYSHDVPQRRRAVVAALPSPDAASSDSFLTRDRVKAAKNGR
jgi:integrase